MGPFMQWLLLTCITVAFVTPRMIHVGTNIVTDTYKSGATRLLSGNNPYAPPHGTDNFEYSPFFAFVYAPIAKLPPKPQALIWAIINCALFWAGIGAWFSWEKQRSKWLAAALIVCAMELNISVLYQQVNASLIGITLLGLAWYRDGKLGFAGFLLSIATDIKLLPGIFAFSLLFPLRSRYLLGLSLGFSTALAAPALAVGWNANIELHRLWILSLSNTWHMVRPVQLDILSVLQKWGYSGLGSVLRALILLSSGLLLVLSSMNRRVSWYPWIAIGACCLLLVSPRSESPTFVMMAPVYIFLTAFFIDSSLPDWARWAGLGSLCVIAFLVTIGFTDLWARKSWAPFQLAYSTKTIGTAFLWVLAVLALIREWMTSHQRPIFLSERPLFQGLRLR
jgi:hypothetical protein